MALPDAGADLIVAIASDDTWTHIYPSLDRMLDHNDEAHGQLGAVEFFDSRGRRLATGFDAAWGLAALAPASDPPDPGRLRQRLQTVIQHVADHMRAHPEIVASLPDSPDNIDKWLQALAEDDLNGMTKTIERQTAGSYGGGFQPLHSGGWFHNALHAAGWTH